MQKYFFQRVFLICLFFSCSITLEAEPGVSRFIYLQDGIADFQKVEKQVAIEIWSKWVAQANDYPVSTHSAATMPDFLKLIKKEKIDYALLDSSNFIQYYHQLKPNLQGEIWGVQRSDKIYEEYVLLTRKGNNTTEMNNLEGATLSYNSDFGILKMYLDHFILKTSHKSPRNLFKTIREVKTESQAILDVFFGYTDVCLVTKHAFDASIEMNPAIRNKVKIIHRSGEKFIPVIYIALNNVSEIEQSKFNNAMNNLNNTARGQQMMNLFGIHAIKKIKQNKLHSMLKLNTRAH